MFQCSNKQCNAKYSNQRADDLKGNCDNKLAGGVVCGSPLMDESHLGWHHIDSLRDKPLDPQSGQSIAAAKAKVATAKPAPVVVAAATPVGVLTPAQTKLALKKRLSMAQIAAFTPAEREAFNAEALKEK
jgi:hypothetical protein